MSAHDESARWPPRRLVIGAWGVVLAPLLQLALLSRPLPGGLAARALAQLVEGLVLWWAGGSLALLATARTLHGGQQLWLLPAGMLLCLSAARLVLQHPASGAAPIELGLAAGTGAVLLLTIAGLPVAAWGMGDTWARSSLDTLWILSAAIVIHVSLVPVRPITRPFEPALVLEIAAAGALLTTVALASAERGPGWRGARLPLLMAMLCWLVAGALPLARPAGDVWWSLPLRTLAWALVAVGAARGLTRAGGHSPEAPRLAFRRVVAALAPWGMTGAALLTVAATGVAPGELAALALTGTARELAAALRRHLWEEDALRALQGARRQLAEERVATASRTHALARVVHDQLAPLNGIWGVERELARAGHAAGMRLSAHIELLRVLIEQLRALVRGQAPPLRAVRVDLLRVVDDALGTVAERAIMAGVRTTTSLDAAQQHVLGDPIAVRRILDNLLTNALDAAGEGGSVRVRLWDDPDYPTMLTLVVYDSGPGFDGARDPFAPRPMAEHGQRMGLGLSIVHDLAAAIGGACGVGGVFAGDIPAMRAGGRVWVRLPRADTT